MDLQSRADLRDEMTYVSPTTGNRVGYSFIIPQTQTELQQRGKMMMRWARTGCGMLGRSPDFLNVNFACLWAPPQTILLRIAHPSKRTCGSTMSTFAKTISP